MHDSTSVFAELEQAHAGVDGAGLKRQITYAYVTALGAQFQLYCRAAHTETAQTVLSGVSSPVIAPENRLIPAEIDLTVCRHWNNTLTEMVITIDEVLTVHCEALGLRIRR